PRAMAWKGPETTDEDARRIIGAGCDDRVHAIEYAWLKPMLEAELYAYRLPADGFVPIGDPPHAMVSTEPVTPLGPPGPVGDLGELGGRAGVQLGLPSSLWAVWGEVIANSLEFSGFRQRNARR